MKRFWEAVKNINWERLIIYLAGYISFWSISHVILGAHIKLGKCRVKRTTPKQFKLPRERVYGILKLLVFPEKCSEQRRWVSSRCQILGSCMTQSQRFQETLCRLLTLGGNLPRWTRLTRAFQVYRKIPLDSSRGAHFGMDFYILLHKLLTW